MTTRLSFDCIKNIAEYEACALGIWAAIEFKAKCLNVYGDSMLVIHQIKGEWETRDHPLSSIYQRTNEVFWCHSIPPHSTRRKLAGWCSCHLIIHVQTKSRGRVANDQIEESWTPNLLPFHHRRVGWQTLIFRYQAIPQRSWISWNSHREW